MARPRRALVAISDCENRESLIQVLEACGLEPIFCSIAGQVRAAFDSEAPDIVFCEDTSFADGSFDELPRAICSGESRPPVIVCSRLHAPVDYLDVMDHGAFDYVVYPYQVDDVQWILHTAFRRSSESAPKLKAELGRVTSA